MAPDPGSGNRWEPPVTPAPEPDAIDDAPDSSGPRARGSRGLLAGVAAAFLLGGGAAGYVVGQAATPTATPADQRLDQRFGPGGDHDRHFGDQRGQRP